jgi:hypothetical protein
VVEGAYCRDCQAEDPLGVEAYLEEDPLGVEAYLEEDPLEVEACLGEVPVGEVASLAEIALEGTAAVGFVYSPEDLEILQGTKVAPFARLDVSNVGQEEAVPQASRCTGNSLSQHSYSSLRLEVLL